LASDSQYGYNIDGYNGELLQVAKDLAQRLVPAFQMSRTGIPYPRVCIFTQKEIPYSLDLTHFVTGEFALWCSKKRNGRNMYSWSRKSYIGVWNVKPVN
jgi:hypothetical protein